MEKFRIYGIILGKEVKEMRKLTEQEIARRDKMQRIKDMGIDAFGQKFERDFYAAELKEKLDNETLCLFTGDYSMADVVPSKRVSNSKFCHAIYTIRLYYYIQYTPKQITMQPYYTKI